MACLFGHKWDGCKCEKCGKVREDGHIFVKQSACTQSCSVCGRVSSNHDMGLIGSGDMKSKKCKVCSKEFYPSSNLDSNDRSLLITALTDLCSSVKCSGKEKQEYRDALDSLFQDLEWYPRNALHVACGACKKYPEQMGMKSDSTKRRTYDDLWHKIGVIFGHYPVTLHRFR